jgi:hypothetical protein
MTRMGYLCPVTESHLIEGVVFGAQYSQNDIVTSLTWCIYLN